MEENWKDQERYVQGSTVRHLQPIPTEEEIYKRRQETEKEKREKERQRRKKERELEKFYRMDFRSFLFLLAGTLLIFGMSCHMLSCKASVTQMKKTIALKEKQLSELQKQNDSDLAEINAGIDLTKIYKIATKQLGMVHASGNQVIEYDSTKSDYVRQYGDIRKEKCE